MRQAGAAVARRPRYIRCLHDRHGHAGHFVPGHEFGDPLVDILAAHLQRWLAARLGLGEGEDRRQHDGKNDQQTHERLRSCREVKP
jgi:hypothetical protein